MKIKSTILAIIFGLISIVIIVVVVFNASPTTEVSAAGANPPPLDIAVVFDVSGSMLYESNCFGCWLEYPSLSNDIIANPYPTNGIYNPLDYDPAEDDDDSNDFDIYWGGDPANAGDTTFAGHSVCSAAPAPFVDTNGHRYSIHEAELGASTTWGRG